MEKNILKFAKCPLCPHENGCEMYKTNKIRNVKSVRKYCFCKILRGGAYVPKPLKVKSFSSHGIILTKTAHPFQFFPDSELFQPLLEPTSVLARDQWLKRSQCQCFSYFKLFYFYDGKQQL